ncbi:hypothetical protein Q0590_35055 [Rhodocytophaga aerolata]|uniref:Uncharacterized protein n=1 Tax=Rhodocytophaga aerolata TaxID=455078 RepID=A0ABT8RHK1_9BACT|nr:hypothetical protein [Rhodocytophaga aerolata]MDO1451545.1 hypothetical protein [Rhodocytophaga aerolata]
MTKISAISLQDNEQDLIRELVKTEVEVSMTAFNFNPEFEAIPSNFDKIGNFELDVLAIEKSSGQVVMLDHDQLNFIMGKVAENIYSFVRALIEIEKFFERCQQDEKLYDDEVAMRTVAKKASELAGGSAYVNYYFMTFGI